MFFNVNYNSYTLFRKNVMTTKTTICESNHFREVTNASLLSKLVGGKSVNHSNQADHWNNIQYVEF
jgi:hypothetical protein